MSINPASKIELSRASFSDIDQMVEWSQGVGWENVCTQLTPGANKITLDSVCLPGLIVAHYCVQQSIHNVFTLPEGMVLFVICRTKLPLVWCGRHLPPSMLGIARSGLEHEVVLHAGWDCYEFMVSEDLIRQTEIFPPEFFATTTQLQNAFLPLTEPVTGYFLQCMDAVFAQCKGPHGTPGSVLHRAWLLDFIMRGLLEVADAGLSARGLHRLQFARRHELVAKARDYVSAHRTTDISMDDLAQALGVSYRVLNYAFRDSLGTSPYQYVLTQKLHAARRLLKSADISVLSASAAFGFQTPSRFARQYARLFGELPSDTNFRRRNV
jgi:AraC-like DNA-binding protein